MKKQVFHDVNEWETGDEWCWAVEWKHKPVCFCRKESHAEAVAWALDTAKPRFEDVKDEDTNG